MYSSLKPAQKKAVWALEHNEIDILVGTHALLFQDDVEYYDLGMVVADEQHRFGVTCEKCWKRGKVISVDGATPDSPYVGDSCSVWMSTIQELPKGALRLRQADIQPFHESDSGSCAGKIEGISVWSACD